MTEPSNGVQPHMGIDYYIERGVLLTLSDFSENLSITEPIFLSFKTHLESLPWFTEEVGDNTTEESDDDVSNGAGTVDDFQDIAGFHAWLKSCTQNVDEIYFIQQVLQQLTAFLEQKLPSFKLIYMGSDSLDEYPGFDGEVDSILVCFESTECFEQRLTEAGRALEEWMGGEIPAEDEWLWISY